jgi:transposase
MSNPGPLQVATLNRHETACGSHPGPVVGSPHRDGGFRKQTRRAGRACVMGFDSSRRLVAYLGLDPKVRQSGEEPARRGRISKRGNAQARAVLVEAAWSAVRSPGPLRAFGERVRARKGSQVAAVAVARKIACLCWQLLAKEEDYAYARPSLMRAKIRRAELDAGAPPRSKRHGGKAVSASAEERQAERELVEHAEAAYRRLVADWKATGAKGAGATTGRASSGPSAGQAARQESAPEPALQLGRHRRRQKLLQRR